MFLNGDEFVTSMRDILMLDLEGTLFSGISRKLEYFERPKGDKFLEECQQLFDTIYLNTSVPEVPAMQVMKRSFPSNHVDNCILRKLRTRSIFLKLIR